MHDCKLQPFSLSQISPPPHPKKVTQKMEACWTEAGPLTSQPYTRNLCLCLCIWFHRGRPVAMSRQEWQSQWLPRRLLGLGNSCSTGCQDSWHPARGHGRHSHFQEHTFSTSKVTHGTTWKTTEVSCRGPGQGLWETEEHLLPAFVLYLRLWLHLHPFSDWWKGLATPNCSSGFFAGFGWYLERENTGQTGLIFSRIWWLTLLRNQARTSSIQIWRNIIVSQAKEQVCFVVQL